MERFTFKINATPAQFAGWMLRHAASVDLPTEKGFIRLDAPQVQGLPVPARVSMSGVWHLVQEQDGTTAATPHPSTRMDYITFDLSGVGAERVEVTAWCRDLPPRTGEVFADILAQIADTWPEARPDINRYLGKPEPQNDDIRRLPPGRPSNELYDAAYERIKAGEPLGDVFRWWSEQKDAPPDDKGRFKSAMRRRKAKRGTK